MNKSIKNSLMLRRLLKSDSDEGFYFPHLVKSIQCETHIVYKNEKFLKSVKHQDPTENPSGGARVDFRSLRSNALKEGHYSQFDSSETGETNPGPFKDTYSFTKLYTSNTKGIIGDVIDDVSVAHLPKYRFDYEGFIKKDTKNEKNGGSSLESLFSPAYEMDKKEKVQRIHYSISSSPVAVFRKSFGKDPKRTEAGFRLLCAGMIVDLSNSLVDKSQHGYFVQGSFSVLDCRLDVAFAKSENLDLGRLKPSSSGKLN